MTDLFSFSQYADADVLEPSVGIQVENPHVLGPKLIEMLGRAGENASASQQKKDQAGLS